MNIKSSYGQIKDKRVVVILNKVRIQDFYVVVAILFLRIWKKKNKLLDNSKKERNRLQLAANWGKLILLWIDVSVWFIDWKTFVPKISWIKTMVTELEDKQLPEDTYQILIVAIIVFIIVLCLRFFIWSFNFYPLFDVSVSLLHINSGSLDDIRYNVLTINQPT